MPDVSQETLDAIAKAMSGVKNKLEQQQNIKFVSREVTGLLVAGLKPTFAQFESTIRTALLNYLSEIKNIRITTPPIGVQDIKANVQAHIPEIKIPEINTKSIEEAIRQGLKGIKIPAPIIPEIKVPEIKIPEVKMPKVKDIVVPKHPVSFLGGDLGKTKVNVNKDNPLPVILTDEKGKFYKALMTAISAGGGGGGNSFEELKSVTTPVISNTLLAVADTEYSVILSKGTKKFKIYAVDSTRVLPHSAVLRYSYTSLGNGSWAAKTCVPIPRGNYNQEEGLNLKEPTTIYFSSPTGGNAVVIIIAWQ